jgi:hypothetical protein
MRCRWEKKKDKEWKMIVGVVVIRVNVVRIYMITVHRLNGCAPQNHGVLVTVLRTNELTINKLNETYTTTSQMHYST